MVMETIQNSIETKGGMWGYYRQPNGWITTSIVTPIEKLGYTEEGWTHLPQYGLVELTTQYAANHPLEALFLMGGAHELPVEQIIEMGLYIDPPLLPSCKQRLNQYHKLHNATCWRNAQRVHFPQIDGMDLQPWQCRHCKEIRATEAGRAQHETVVHKDEKGDLKMAESLAFALNRRDAPASLLDMAEIIAAALDKRSTVQPSLEQAEEIAALRAELAALKVGQAPRRKRRDGT